MTTQQREEVGSIIPYRKSSMDGKLMRLRLMQLLVMWVKAHKEDPRLLVRFMAWNMASFFTVVRVILAYPVPWQLAIALVWLNGHHGLVNTAVVVAWIVVLLCVFATDAVDGTMSNQSGTQSRFGEITDPAADKGVIGCTVYFLAWTGSQILPPAVTMVMIPAVATLVALDIASAVVTLGEELRARLIQGVPAGTESWGKRKMYAQCIGTIGVLVGLVLLAAGAQWAGLMLVCFGIAVLVAAIVLGALSVWHHWGNLAGRRPSSITIALATPALGAIWGTILYRKLQSGAGGASLMHVAMAVGAGSAVFLSALALLYLPTALRVRRLGNAG